MKRAKRRWQQEAYDDIEMELESTRQKVEQLQQQLTVARKKLGIWGNLVGCKFGPRVPVKINGRYNQAYTKLLENSPGMPFVVWFDTKKYFWAPRGIGWWHGLGRGWEVNLNCEGITHVARIYKK